MLRQFVLIGASAMILGSGYEALKWWMSTKQNKQEPTAKVLPLDKPAGVKKSECRRTPHAVKFAALKQRDFGTCHRMLGAAKHVR